MKLRVRATGYGYELRDEDGAALVWVSPGCGVRRACMMASAEDLLTILETLVYWNEHGSIDQSWRDDAARVVGLAKGGES